MVIISVTILLWIEGEEERWLREQMERKRKNVCHGKHGAKGKNPVTFVPCQRVVCASSQKLHPILSEPPGRNA